MLVQTSVAAASNGLPGEDDLDPDNDGPRGRVAFLFPGQGVQRVGMGSLALTSPAARRVWELAEDISGIDLRRLRAHGPAAELTKTEVAQVAVVTCSLAAEAMLSERGIRPHVVAGHSVGELAAVCAAGAVSREEAIRLAAVRGRLMATVMADGTMAAIIGLEQQEVELCCHLAREAGCVVVAAYNGPRNMVVSGDRAAVELCVRLASGRGALRATHLVTSNAFHSPLMAPALPGWREAVERAAICDADIEVVAGATGAAIRDQRSIRDALIRQMLEPVRWEETVTTLRRGGTRLAVECGDSKVLAGLVRLAGAPIAVRVLTSSNEVRRLAGDFHWREESTVAGAPEDDQLLVERV